MMYSGRYASPIQENSNRAGEEDDKELVFAKKNILHRKLVREAWHDELLTALDRMSNSSFDGGCDEHDDDDDVE